MPHSRKWNRRKRSGQFRKRACTRQTYTRGLCRGGPREDKGPQEHPRSMAWWEDVHREVEKLEVHKHTQKTDTEKRLKRNPYKSWRNLYLFKNLNLWVIWWQSDNRISCMMQWTVLKLKVNDNWEVIIHHTECQRVSAVVRWVRFLTF